MPVWQCSGARDSDGFDARPELQETWKDRVKANYSQRAIGNREFLCFRVLLTLTVGNSPFFGGFRKTGWPKRAAPGSPAEPNPRFRYGVLERGPLSTCFNLITLYNSPVKTPYLGLSVPDCQVVIGSRDDILTPNQLSKRRQVDNPNSLTTTPCPAVPPSPYSFAPALS